MELVMKIVLTSGVFSGICVVREIWRGLTW